MPIVNTRMRALIGVLAVLTSACAKTLPEQDRRILEATAIAKLSTDDIWKDYQQNPADADAKYWGKAVEVSGKVAGVVKDSRQLLFGSTDNPQVRAALLDDQAAEILGAAADGQRIRLKCFCAGLQQAVILKSCVKP